MSVITNFTQKGMQNIQNMQRNFSEYAGYFRIRRRKLVA